MSGNATLLDGGADDDTPSMSALTETYQDGGEPGTAALSGNAFTLLGKGGRDLINAFLGASADEGGTASTTDNAVLLRGGSASDTLQFVMSASAFDAAGGGSTTTTRGNVVTMMGAGGGDILSVELDLGANAGSKAALVDNTLALTGGSGNDRLFVGYDLGLQDGRTTAAGNSFLLAGGTGNDSLGVTIFDLGENRIVLAGGQGHDLATVDYRVEENLVFDFSGGYRQTVERDVTLLGIDRVWIFSGSGDDEFIGGSGNDIFEGGAGEDTASFDGGRDDYRVRVLDSGYVRVTDLRNGSPDGTDLYNSVDHFIFSGREVDLA